MDPGRSSGLRWLVVALVATVLAVPFATALLVAAVAAPALPAANPCTTSDVSTIGPWREPFAQNYTRTSPFGMRVHPITGVRRLHAGIDLASLPAPGPVVAAHAGTVRAAGYQSSYGNHVDLDHGRGVLTRYAHLASIAPGLRPGTPVAAGQVLGLEGSTGTSTGNHLHFEVRLAGQAVDPVPFMAAHGASLDGHPDSTTKTATSPTTSSPAASNVLPAPGPARRSSLHTPPAPIPPRVRTLYVAAGAKYRIDWALLAGVGMEETRHGATAATSSAGARGLMQFLPATFAAYGVDGDGDGRTDITNDADSIFTAARYLAAQGATRNGGIRAALFAYNHADWYVGDVLAYAHAYAATGTTGCAATELASGTAPLVVTP